MNALTVTEPLSLVLGRMNEIQEAERATIALMPGMSGDELLHVLAYAKTMGAASWRIECAAHAEIVGRKPKHGEKAGLIAAAAQLAGCAPGTVYRNADIHGMAQIAPDIEEKSVFVEVWNVLPREDWADTVTMLANKLHSRENYGVRDVKADIHARRGGETTEKTEVVSNVSLRLDQDAMRELTAVCARRSLTPSQWAMRALWLDRGRATGNFCVGISEEQLAWLAQKAAKRVETYGPDDEKGTPEGYLEFVLRHRMRESERRR